jgi:hypothetical protein
MAAVALHLSLQRQLGAYPFEARCPSLDERGLSKWRTSGLSSGMLTRRVPAGMNRHSEEVTRYGASSLSCQLSIVAVAAKPRSSRSVARYLLAVLSGAGAPEPASDPPVDLLGPLYQHERPDPLDELCLRPGPGEAGDPVDLLLAHAVAAVGRSVQVKNGLLYAAGPGRRLLRGPFR